MFDMKGYAMKYVVGYVDADGQWVTWSYCDVETMALVLQACMVKDLEVGLMRTWEIRERPKRGMADWLVEERRLKL